MPEEREELEIGKFSLGQLTQMIREIVTLESFPDFNFSFRFVARRVQ